MKGVLVSIAIACAAFGAPAASARAPGGGASPRALPAAAAGAADVTKDPRIVALRATLIADPAKAVGDSLSVARQHAGTGPVGALVAIAADWIRAAAQLELNRPADSARTSEGALAAVARLAPGSALQAELLLAHGGARAAAGDVQRALADYQAAFTIFGAAHVPRSQAIALQNIALIYQEAHDYKNAIRYTEQSLELSSDPMIRLSGYNNIATCYSDLEQHETAAAYFQKALPPAREVGSPLLEVRVLRNLARSLVLAHRLAAAQSALADGFRLAESGPAASWRPALLSVAAELAIERHDLPAAVAYVKRAFAEVKGGAAALPMVNLHGVAYRVYRAQGDAALALQHLEASKALDDQATALAASTNAALMSARFDFANQDLKITRLRQAQAEHEAVLAQTRVRYHMILSGGLAAAALTISTLLAIGFVSIRRSRNQVRAANETLRKTNADLERALDAKSEFLATTSHEIRTPLNGILGMTQVLLADHTIAPGLRGRVELIHGAGETMRALVDDILDMAKMETGELRIHPAPMDLQRLLRDASAVWAGQAETKGIALKLDVSDAPADIVADEVRLRQIVFNLMANAIKFTDHGQVCLRACAEPADGGERLRLAIEDSGIGIPGDRLDEIFEAFRQVDGGVTRRHGGTGLGLAICRNLARAMGGDVHVQSVLGAGSTFTVTLPLERAAVAENAPDAARREPPTGLAAADVLLIEPNPLSQGILRALLAPHVGRLHVFASPELAREVLAAGVDHVLADAAAFGGVPQRALDFAEAAGVAQVTLLWPAPDEATVAILTNKCGMQLLAKPIPATELLARLRMLYAMGSASQELAA